MMISASASAGYDAAFAAILSLPEMHQQSSVAELFRRMIFDDHQAGIEAIRRNPLIRVHALNYTLAANKPSHAALLLQGEPLEDLHHERLVLEAVKIGSLPFIEALVSCRPLTLSLQQKSIMALNDHSSDALISRLIPEGALDHDQVQETFINAACRGSKNLMKYLMKNFPLEKVTVYQALKASILHRKDQIFELFPSLMIAVDQELIPELIDLAVLHRMPRLFHAIDSAGLTAEQKNHFMALAIRNESWGILGVCIERGYLTDDQPVDLILHLCKKKVFHLVDLLIDRFPLNVRLRSEVLRLAAIHNEASIVVKLIKNWAEVEREALGQALIYAARNRSSVAIHALLTRVDFDPRDLLEALEITAFYGPIDLTIKIFMRVRQMPLDRLFRIITHASSQDQWNVVQLFLDAACHEQHLRKRLIDYAQLTKNCDLFGACVRTSRLESFQQEMIEGHFYTFCSPCSVPTHLKDQVELPRILEHYRIKNIHEAIDGLDLSQARVATNRLVEEIQHSSLDRLIALTRIVPMAESDFLALSDDERRRIILLFFSHGFGSTSMPINFATYLHLCAITHQNHAKLHQRLIGNFTTQDIDKMREIGMPNPKVRPNEYRKFFKQIYFELAHIGNYFDQQPQEEQGIIILRILECMNECSSQMQAGIHALFCQLIKKEVRDPLLKFVLDGVEEEFERTQQVVLAMQEEQSTVDVHYFNLVQESLASFSCSFQPARDAVYYSVDLDHAIKMEYKRAYNPKRLVHSIRSHFSLLPMELKAEFATRWFSVFPMKDNFDDEWGLKIEEYLQNFNIRFQQFLRGDRSCLTKQELMIAEEYQKKHGFSAKVSSPTFIEFSRSSWDRLKDQPALLCERDQMIEQLERIHGHLDDEGQLKPGAVIEWLVHLKLLRAPKAGQAMMRFLT